MQKVVASLTGTIISFSRMISRPTTHEICKARMEKFIFLLVERDWRVCLFPTYLMHRSFFSVQSHSKTLQESGTWKIHLRGEKCEIELFIDPPSLAVYVLQETKTSKNFVCKKKNECKLTNMDGVLPKAATCDKVHQHISFQQQRQVTELEFLWPILYHMRFDVSSVVTCNFLLFWWWWWWWLCNFFPGWGEVSGFVKRCTNTNFSKIIVSQVDYYKFASPRPCWK